MVETTTINDKTLAKITKSESFLDPERSIYEVFIDEVTSETEDEPTALPTPPANSTLYIDPEPYYNGETKRYDRFNVFARFDNMEDAIAFINS